MKLSEKFEKMKKKHEIRKLLVKKKEEKEEKERKERKDERTKALSKKFIKIYFKVVLNKNLKKEEVEEIAEKILLIMINTQGIWTGKEFIDTINPYLNKNAVMGNNLTGRGMLVRTLCKSFLYKIKRHPSKDWIIEISPKNKSGKIELYSLFELNNDYFILGDINNYILEQLKWDGKGDTFNPIFIEEKPAIERKVGNIFRIEYKVEDRIKYGKNIDEDFDEFLGAQTDEYFRIVKKGIFLDKNIKLSKEKEKDINRWIKEVEKLIGEEKLK